MEAEDPLSQLADIHLPQAVPFWPPAPGWWLLAALLLALLAGLGFLLYRRWQRGRRMAHALTELDQAYAQYRKRSADVESANQAGLDFLYAVNSILKRVALVHYPDSEVASLSGSAWLEFLAAHGGRRADFIDGPGAVLAYGEYRPHFDADAGALHRLARSWIRTGYSGSKTGRATANGAAAGEATA